MSRVSRYDLYLMENILKLSETGLLKGLPQMLSKWYSKDKIIITSKYIYVLGEIPITLVAHLDTVHGKPPSDYEIYHDIERGVLWSPAGLGADDRAGVFSILKIVASGYRPSIIFTTGEEIGGQGAQEFVKKYFKPLVKTNFLIELDRSGWNDSVYYECGSIDFQEYIDGFGFVKDEGSYSDILFISRVWEIPSVNLSIGYYFEHSTRELWNYLDTFETIEKVMLILENELEEDHIFEWVNRYDASDICGICGLDKPTTNSYKVYSSYLQSYLTLQVCEKCEKDYIHICEKCGEHFVSNVKDKKICYKCGAEAEV